MNSIEIVQPHVERTIGRVKTVFHEIISDDLHIDLLHVGSTLLRPYEVVVTSGMSALPMNVPQGITAPSFAEVLVILPKGWPMKKDDFFDEKNYWPIRLLKDVARYTHHQKTWIGYGHTIAMAESEQTKTRPEQYAPGTDFCAALIMPPLTLGNKAWVLKGKDGQDIYFWSVIPLYSLELQLKMEQGLDSLLNLFDRHKVFDRINPSRKSVV
jgi:hypothetical protein